VIAQQFRIESNDLKHGLRVGYAVDYDSRFWFGYFLPRKWEVVFLAPARVYQDGMARKSKSPSVGYYTVVVHNTYVGIVFISIVYIDTHSRVYHKRGWLSFIDL
jgi:hypothetical protein